MKNFEAYLERRGLDLGIFFCTPCIVNLFIAKSVRSFFLYMVLISNATLVVVQSSFSQLSLAFFDLLNLSESWGQVDFVL